MIITQKSSKLGTPIIIFACLVFFIGYFILIKEPMQAMYIKAHKRPPLVPWLLIGLVDGLLFGFLTRMGFEIGKINTFKSVNPIEIKSDSLLSKSLWVWTIMWGVAICIVTLVWRNGDF